MGDHDSVNEPGLAYQEMRERGQWQLLEDLWGGTPGMRDARTRRLPKFAKEDDGDYNARLGLNFLYPMWKRTLGRLVSKPYSKPVTWTEDEALPKRLRQFLEDIDGAGTSLTQFSRAWFEQGGRWGIGHALVDFTPIELNLDGTRKATRREEEEAGVRPSAIRIAPPNLIDWRHERRKGEEVLVEIRYRGKRTVRDGFEQKTVDTVTHYTDTFSQVYVNRQDGGGKQEWEPEEAIPHTFGRVPLEPWYANRTGVMMAEPPLLGLAEVNAQHWQYSADHSMLVYTLGHPRLMFTGLTTEERAAAASHSAKRLVFGGPDAKGAWIEHSGAGMGSIEAAIQKAEDRAEALSAKPTSRDRSPVTATGEVRGEQDASCDLMAWVDAQEDGLLRVLKIAAEWLKETVPPDFAFQIHRGFTIGPESGREIDQIQKDAQEGRITTATCLRETQRRGLYSDDMDPEDEAQKGSDEASTRALALIGGEGDPSDDPQGDAA